MYDVVIKEVDAESGECDPLPFASVVVLHNMFENSLNVKTGLCFPQGLCWSLLPVLSWPDSFVTADQNQQRNVVAAVGRPRPVNEDRPAGAPRVRRNLRNRLLARRLLEAEQDAQVEEVGAEQDGTEFQTHGKIGAKKQRKLEEKEQRKAQREAEEAEREERRKLQMKRDEDRKKDEERLRLEEQQKEEELKKAWEEKQRREHDEYLKLKEAFTVEEEGIEVQPDEEESQNLLQEFIGYIKSMKVVLLEDLASHFGLRTQEAINRVQDLIAEGTLTGVLDDRGKFIYITEQELAAVAQFIRQQGRISIVELAQASNTLINLNPESRSIPESVA
ncbi:DDRGK domain-containing protein 1 isoform X1 [Chiloscyllium plagiosum]|uniref:DDRGK domain-containing protein 1 isoform X1 n=1 Tax=Chiloscyllium plagiosum TaxID=36176 RepID=UPI001CB871B0|nr:DDRGK domain-containing protein 1 isoform X1 [Chiloscyllium plagiosum]